MVVTEIPGNQTPPRSYAEWLARHEGEAFTSQDHAEAFGQYATDAERATGYDARAEQEARLARLAPGS